MNIETFKPLVLHTRKFTVFLMRVIPGRNLLIHNYSKRMHELEKTEKPQEEAKKSFATAVYAKNKPKTTITMRFC